MQERRKRTTYWGERYRSSCERMEEHLRDLDKEKVESHMLWHIEDKHPEVTGKKERRENYVLKVERTFTRPIEIQIH